MTTVHAAHAGDAHTRFDRDHGVRSHLPLVRRSRARYGLARDGASTVALCLCRFRDEAAVMADVPRFTDFKPTQSRAVPVPTRPLK